MSKSPHLQQRCARGPSPDLGFTATPSLAGGRVQLLASVDEIDTAFSGILAELRGQYVLGFYPERARHDGRWRRLRVRLRPPGVEVRCREGYVDY